MTSSIREYLKYLLGRSRQGPYLYLLFIWINKNIYSMFDTSCFLRENIKIGGSRINHFSHVQVILMVLNIQVNWYKSQFLLTPSSIVFLESKLIYLRGNKFQKFNTRTLQLQNNSRAEKWIYDGKVQHMWSVFEPSAPDLLSSRLCDAKVVHYGSENCGRCIITTQFRDCCLTSSKQDIGNDSKLNYLYRD